jgi:hypothetical protein
MLEIITIQTFANHVIESLLRPFTGYTVIKTKNLRSLTAEVSFLMLCHHEWGLVKRNRVTSTR